MIDDSVLTNREIRLMQRDSGKAFNEINRIAYKRFREVEEDRDNLVDELTKVNAYANYLESLLKEHGIQYKSQDEFVDSLRAS